ncbi:probable G-protein coupled receptor B0563.6 isoform X2 [Odontomachus brunneus]|nr:probable G-protein coupled receptor B0563.6 isoform X2 [Odontomachus brunneus]XP_032675016.1 probable G-protein coupled receptor B0563.6 isoform X2 [Odontomachus brunneus]XP_032675017.1 probable G-protein coupled receptor B0563.6 isoform X2 [Odontomachus brunneus]XP_032675018.1 probable G-protein coupled receptor B0563.6 isoform X2 [Odontomachus brunneus]XP_032675019.1 probable G-protein coupled receptor B0563.6 isoform X2 [Odontomachus brunneus]XP_032675020.1 probable G-protein coupled rec
MSLVWTSYGIIVPIILIVGIFGNVAILIVLSSPVFRGIAYLYLSGLALAHIGVALSWITITLRLGYGMSGNYLSAFYHAHLELVILNTFSAASVLIMVCLIVDRYIFVFFPARIRTGNARKNVSSFILSSFIAGFVISIPLSFMRITYEEQDGPSTSFTLRENVFITRSMIWRAYIWAMEIVVRICPSILFIILNSFVIMRFLQLNVQNRQFHAVSDKFRTNNAPDTSLLSRNRGYIEEQHLAILTTTMILCFFITTIPSSLVPILYPNRHSLDLRYQTFRVCSAIVELSNYAIYILIYLVCSTEFRKGLLRFLQGRCNENMVQDIDQPVGEIEDFSRHGTTVRLTPEHTKLNSPESPTNKETRVEEDSHALDATASMLERRVIA